MCFADWWLGVRLRFCYWVRYDLQACLSIVQGVTHAGRVSEVASKCVVHATRINDALKKTVN